MLIFHSWLYLIFHTGSGKPDLEQYTARVVDKPFSHGLFYIVTVINGDELMKNNT